MRRGLVGIMAVLAASLGACGDDGAPDRTIALLRSAPIDAEHHEALLAELEESGWSVGENLTLLGDAPDDIYPDLDAARAAVEGWVEDGADLIIALSTTSAMAARDATSEVPILAFANDPVASGIIADPRSPEGNVTGVRFRVPPDRTIDLARQLVVGASTIGFLWPSHDPAAEPVRDGLVTAAASLDVDLLVEPFVGPEEVQGAVDRMVAAGAQVVLLANAPATVRAFEAIEAATTAARLPAVGNIESNPFAVIILAPQLEGAYRQVGRQAVRLLRGTDVADVPVEDPGVFRLIVRPDNAERLGVTVSDELLAQADEVSD